jgi:hypothetical protein
MLPQHPTLSADASSESLHATDSLRGPDSPGTSSTHGDALLDGSPIAMSLLSDAAEMLGAHVDAVAAERVAAMRGLLQARRSSAHTGCVPRARRLLAPSPSARCAACSRHAACTCPPTSP